MKIAVILGYYLNDDGSPNVELIKRMDLTTLMYKELHPDYILLSGGIANKKAGISEASVMKELLLKRNINENILLLEEQSTTTKENAIYSAKILDEYNIDELIIVSSLDHFINQPYNTIKYFVDEINNKDIKIVIYTKDLS